MTRTLLALCARPEATQAQQQLILRHLASFSEWDRLPNAAEQQGMAPLLYRHLEQIDAPVPKETRRALKGLFLQHRRANAVRMEYLVKVLDCLETAGIEALVLKGAALCHLIYPDPGLRPMCDLDLLVRKADLEAAKSLLLGNGFHPSAPTVNLFGEHHHVEPFVRTHDGLAVSVELHHHLFPPQYPIRNPGFADLAPAAAQFDVGGRAAGTLGIADMLWHLYQHGFRVPLIDAPFRLISAADIIGMVEKNIHRVDWKAVFLKYPELKTALPLFHHLSPWSESVIRRLSVRVQKSPTGVGEPFNGWPKQPLARIRDPGKLSFVRGTLWPSEWWFRLYYAPSGRFSYYWCRLAGHPRHLLKWVWIIWPYFRASRRSRHPGIPEE